MDDTRSGTIIVGGGISVAEGHIWGPKAPQPAKWACLPQGLALGARSAPFTLVHIRRNMVIERVDDLSVSRNKIIIN